MKKYILISIIASSLCLTWCFTNKNLENQVTAQNQEDINNQVNNWTTQDTETIENIIITGDVQEETLITNNHTDTPDNNNTESIEYENKLFQFKLEIPSNWKFKENSNWFDLILNTPKNDEINENLWIKIQQPKVEQNLESYIGKTIEELQSIYTDFATIETKKTTFNNWISIVYEFSDNWLDLKAQQTVFLINNNSYVFTYTATKETFDQYIETVNKIINSFSLLN